MRALLLSKGLWEVVTGKKEDEAKSDKTLGLMQLYLSEYYSSMADGVATAKDLWDKLEDSFKAKNNARRLILRQELTNLRKKPSETVTAYLARAREIASNLEAVGSKPEPSDITLPVLAGLPRQYSTLVTILGTSKEEYSLDDILPMLLQMEQQVSKEEEDERFVPSYAAMRNMSISNKRCHYCNQPGHIRAHCNKRKSDQERKRSSNGPLYAVGGSIVL